MPPQTPSSPSRSPAVESLVPGRILVDPPGAGNWNMAVDQVMLQSVAANRFPILRFYRWSTPTLSLGYFQSLADRSQHTESQDVAVVRRTTGGGAILHDRELTYSIALPLQSQSRYSIEPIYKKFHATLCAALGAMGVQATRHADQSQGPVPERAEQPIPFLCFQRRSDEDLIVAGYKILGSAQRRVRGAMLQHGSILLSASPYAPQLPGINDLSGQPITHESLLEAVLNRLSCFLPDPLQASFDWKTSDWQPDEVAAAKKIAVQRFANAAWTQRR